MRLLRAACTWPVFSLTSFRMLDSLRRQGIAPRTVIDAGANVGQFAVAAIRLLEPAMLYSFEPLPGIFDRLQKNLAGIEGVAVLPVALGDHEGSSTFHINAHSHSSSILPLAAAHLAAFPNATEVQTIKVPMTTLDSFFADKHLDKPVLLKLDVQGYEAKVLAGGRQILSRTKWVVAETSLRPMYEGEPLFLDLVEMMKGFGFRFLRPVGWLKEPHSGEIIQIDALFERIGSETAGF